MARNGVLDGFQYARPRQARLGGLMIAGAVLALGSFLSVDACGSGIFRDLTVQDRSQPILLSQAGDVISLRSAQQPDAGQAFSAVPAYLAFPLDGGEHIPARTPTIATGTQAGDAGVGPLDLTPSVQPTLNADLLASRGAIVNAPDGSYAVAILPRYARALAQEASSGSGGTAGQSGATTIESILGLNPQANWTIQGIPSSKLSQWFKTGTNEISHLTTLGVDGLSKSLGLKVASTSSNSGTATVAAQELIPPTSASPAPAPAAFATPEPAGWLVFGLILVAAGLRYRANL